MTRAAVRGLLGRKLRTALTALAIVLGVAMVSAAYVLTDTMSSAADELKNASYGGIDAVVTARSSFEGMDDEHWTTPPPIDAALLPRVRALDEVALATGEISDEADLLGRDGKPLGGDAPHFAAGVETSRPGFERLTPFKLSAGRFPRGGGEIAIDAGSADKQRFRLGDTVAVSTRGPARRFRVAGIVSFGDVRSIGGATVALFDLPTAQRLFRKRGQLDGISIAARPGTSREQLQAAVAPILPPTAKVESAAAADRFGFEGLSQGVGFLQSFLLGFAGVSLFVGAFIIFNTLSITVAQRSRELALLRTIGATRRQVLRSVLLETLLLGLAASLAGLLAGFGLAKGLSALFVAMEVDLPRGDTVIAPRTAIVSILAGVLVTVVAGLVPALRATRVPPVGALREGAELPPSRAARLAPLIAVLTTAAGLAGMAYGMFADGVSAGGRVAAIVLGCLVLFVGVGLLSPKLVPPLASLLGRPGERLAGAAGALARRNVARNPGRTAATAAALMIGLALVTFVATMAEGIGSAFSSSLEKQVRADYVVSGGDGWSPFSPEATDAVRRVPGVDAVSVVREDSALAFGEIEGVMGIDPATAGRALAFEWRAGGDADLRSLGPGGAIVTAKYAKEHGLERGERFELRAQRGETLRMTVRAVHAPPEFNPLNLSQVLISQAEFGRAFESDEHRYTLILAGPEAEKPLAGALAGFPDARVETRAQMSKRNEESGASFVNLLYVLLALSVVISLFGIVNTLVLAIFERTRELGILRALGMTRRQVRRMVRQESVVTSLIGAALGLPLGVFLAALVAYALREHGATFALPVGMLIVFAIVAALAGVLAAILPARRAARLDVLRALQYE